MFALGEPFLFLKDEFFRLGKIPGLQTVEI